MNRHLIASVSRHLGVAALALACLAVSAIPARAGGSQLFTLHATGQVVSQVPCSETQLCQDAVVSGKATRFGAFTGQLSEVVDLTTGSYTGTGTFVTTKGDALNTEYVGRVTQPDATGGVTFVENHRVVGGTGQFAGATGQLVIVGSADGAGRLSIDGIGLLTR